MLGVWKKRFGGGIRELFYSRSSFSEWRDASLRNFFIVVWRGPTKEAPLPISFTNYDSKLINEDVSDVASAYYSYIDLMGKGGPALLKWKDRFALDNISTSIIGPGEMGIL